MGQGKTKKNNQMASNVEEPMEKEQNAKINWRCLVQFILKNNPSAAAEDIVPV